MSFTPVPIIIRTEKPEDPKCPRCGENLPGWSGPGDTSILGMIVFLLIVFQAAFLLVGVSDALLMNKYSECGKWFEKRWNYVVPTYQVSCKSMEWLLEKKDE